MADIIDSLKDILTDGENDVKEQINLLPGSGEYTEYKLDKNKIDEKEQDNILGKGLEVYDALLPKREHRKAIEKPVKDLVDDLKSHNIENSKQQIEGMKRRAAKSAFKLSQAKKLKKVAKKQALKTETLEDDKIATDIDELSEDLAYDNNVDIDEYIPKSIKKYIE